MNKIDDKKIKDIIHSIGLANNLTDDEVRNIVESQFRFTYETIKNLSFSDLSEEEIDNLKTNFYFKYLGKLYTNSETIRRTIRKDEIIKQKKNVRTNEFKSE